MTPLVAEVVPSWRLLQENRLMMEAAMRLVAERAERDIWRREHEEIPRRRIRWLRRCAVVSRWGDLARQLLQWSRARARGVPIATIQLDRLLTW